MPEASFAIMQGNRYVQEDGSLSESRYLFTTDEEGKFKVDNVLPGDYVLIETEAPSGYQRIRNLGFAVEDEDVVLKIVDPLHSEDRDDPHPYHSPETGIDN